MKVKDIRVGGRYAVMVPYSGWSTPIHSTVLAVNDPEPGYPGRTVRVKADGISVEKWCRPRDVVRPI